jgi:hypothetical protein
MGASTTRPAMGPGTSLSNVPHILSYGGGLTVGRGMPLAWIIM